MFGFFEYIFANRRRIEAFGVYPTLEAAEKYAEDNLNVIYMERDDDGYEATNMFVKSGRVLAIEPVRSLFS